MKHEHFNWKEHGFVGHLAEPEGGSEKAVIVIMGGEQSLLPGIKFAERFADYGITGLAVSLFGAEGLPEGVDQIPLDMFIPAVDYLKRIKKIEHISVYGQSMGSIFAVLVAQYIGGIENLIMVSPTHVPFEGTRDKKSMSGRSVATFQGKNNLEKTNARILLIAGAEDEAWPAEYSVKALKKYLDEQSYEKEVKVILYPHGSHLNGLMPNRQREKRLYRMIPLIGLMYKTFGKYRKENMEYFEQTEQEIIHWIQ